MGFLHVRISDEDRERLKELAEDKEVSASMWLRLVIREKHDELDETRAKKKVKK